MKDYSLRFGTGDPRTFTGLSPTMLFFVRLSDGATLSPPAITERYTGTGIYAFQFGTTQAIAFLADAATSSPGAAARYVNGQIDPADRADEYGTTMVAIGTSHIAQGVSIIAQNVTLIALGTTGVAIGTTLFGIGTSHIAQGVSILAQGSSILSFGVSLMAYGASNYAYGTSNFALGTSIYALEQSLGSTLLGIGNTGIALGNTILALVSIGDSLLIAIGSTASSAGDSSTDPSTLFGYMKRVSELIQGQQQFVKGSGALTMYDRTGATTFVTRTIGNNATLVTKT